MKRISLTVKIKDDLNRKFRKTIIDKYGIQRGWISKSIEEAIKLWLKENEEQEVSNPSSKKVNGDQGIGIQG